MKVIGACGGCTKTWSRPAARVRASGDPEDSDRMAAGERVRQRAAVDVLELAADRHAVRDAARLDLARRGALTEEMRRGLTLDRRIGGEDDLAHLARIQQRFEFAGADL